MSDRLYPHRRTGSTAAPNFGQSVSMYFPPQTADHEILSPRQGRLLLEMLV